MNTELHPIENQIPARTTPTWDMELLISGATVFGLMQLPAPVNQFLRKWIEQSDSALAEYLNLLGIYLQFSLIVMIITFVLHLIQRAYWVALVGMHSVYPNGIKWDKASGAGPIYSDQSMRQGPSIQAAIEHADNRSTKIFGIGLAIALPMLVIALVVAVVIVFLAIAQAAGASNFTMQKIMRWCMVGVIGPFFILYLLDFVIGKYLMKAKLDGLFRKVFSLYKNIGLGAGTNPLYAMVSTQFGVKKVVLMMTGMMFPISIAVIAMTELSNGVLNNGAYDGLPRSEVGAERSLRSDHYASLIADRSKVNLPFIPDPFVKGDYLRLFVPYWPARHNEILNQNCPAALLKAAQKRGDGLDCLESFFDLRIDEKPQAADLFAGEDRASGQRGIWLVMPVAQLIKGQHELSLHSAPRDYNKKEKDKLLRHRIVFWR